MIQLKVIDFITFIQGYKLTPITDDAQLHRQLRGSHRRVRRGHAEEG